MSSEPPVAEVVPDRDRPGAATVRVGGTDQSHVDLDDPTHLAFDYVQRMADVIDAHGEAGTPLRIVHVGGAGMTLARYVAATRPRSPQIVLEPDEQLTRLVREQLPLPRRSGIKVRPVDGRTGVAALRDDSADVVVVDAYVGSRVPADLVTVEFFSDLARVTATGGLVLLNLADRAPFGWTRRVLRSVESVFGHLVLSAEPATLKGRRFGNLLVIASRAPVETAGLARRAASSPFPYRVLAGRDLRDRFAGGRPLTEADSEPSPAPPSGATAFS